MLKWAVNTPRQSYLPELGTRASSIELPLHSFVGLSSINLNSTNDTTLQPHTPCSARHHRRQKRKSADFYLSRRLHHWLEKENQITSTPLITDTNRLASANTLRQLDSLRDVSNIVAASDIKSPKSRIPLLHTNGVYDNPSNYAATLPTLEVEYSPCGLVPGPILALRGVGIPDTYFDKPRYLPPQATALLTDQPPPATQKSKKSHSHTLKPNISFHEEPSTLSSSKMGDQTLERMIDAILESTRKEKKPAKIMKQAHFRQAAMSPTYTAAEDPANDLQELWPVVPERKQQRVRKRRGSLPAKAPTAQLPFKEREVCSPGASKSRLSLNSSSLLHLKRQRVVRRKRRTAKLVIGNVPPPEPLPPPTPDAVADEIAVNETLKLQAQLPIQDNISPDSGHNSCSETEDNSILKSNFMPSEASLPIQSLRALEATKRRLSFSSQHYCPNHSSSCSPES